MKKILFLLLWLAFFMQFSILSTIFSNLNIDVVLLLVVVLSIMYPFEENIIWVLLGGFLIDSFSAAGFGLHLIGFLSTAFIIDVFRRTSLPERRGTIIPLMVLVSSKFIYDILMWLLSHSFHYYRLSGVTFSVFGDNVLRYVSEFVLYLVLGMVAYKLLDKWERSFGRGKSELKLSSS